MRFANTPKSEYRAPKRLLLRIAATLTLIVFLFTLPVSVNALATPDEADSDQTVTRRKNAPAATGAEADVWDGDSVDISWYDPNADTYEISSSAALVGLSYLSNDLIKQSNGFDSDIDAVSFAGKTIEITKDINLAGASFNAIGLNTDFSGTLDGKNHAISNFSSIYGFLGEVDGATIKNVTIDKLTTSSGVVSGGIVAMTTGEDSYVENCTVKNCSINATSYCGAITSYGDGTLHINDCMVENSELNGKIAGGLVGAPLNTFFVDGATVTNTKIVGGQAAGGIIAYDYCSYGSQVKHCVVDADITSTYYAGGIIGLQYRLVSNNYNNRPIIENCTTYGTISGTGQTTYIGGIVGMEALKYYSSWSNMSIINCVSFSTLTLSHGGEVGGIFGDMANRTVHLTYGDLIDYCDFYGTINVTSDYQRANSQWFVGGIVGHQFGYVKNCANFGTIIANSNHSAIDVGGISASTHPGPAMIYNSYNGGDITSNVPNTGGLIGYHGLDSDTGSPEYFSFNNGYNVGKVSNNSHTDETFKPIGLQFWGQLDHVYWLVPENNIPYHFINSFENTSQTPPSFISLGHFYGSDLDITKENSSRIYDITPEAQKPFTVTEETATQTNLLTALNDEAKVQGNMPWVAYPEADEYCSVAQVADYQYPMLGHKSTVEYLTEDDRAHGDAKIVSAGIDYDDDNVYDAAYRTVTVDPQPKSGFKVKSVTAVDGYGKSIEVTERENGTYTYPMARTDVVVTVSYDASDKDMILAVIPSAADYQTAEKARFFDVESFIISIDGDADDENTKDIHVTVALSQGEYLKNNAALADPSAAEYLDFDWTEKDAPTVCGKVVSGLPMGKYRVTLTESWSWRYHTRAATFPVKDADTDELTTRTIDDSAAVEITLSGDIDRPYVLFSESIDPVKWLSAEGMHNSVYSAVSGS